jgi:hypothetical protein
LIDSMHVIPVRDDWQKVLEQTAGAFKAHRTWG